jgi:xanthosine utilization system XapX-like protein
LGRGHRISKAVKNTKRKQTAVTRGLSILFLLAAVAAVLIPASPFNRQAISRDSGVFLYTGWRVIEGDIPYRDVWDHKTPGIFYIDALGLVIDSESLWGVWALEFVFLFAAAYIAYRLLEDLFSLPVAFLASLIWLFALAALLAGGNLTEEYGLPFQFGVLWLFYSSIKNNSWGKRAFWFGVLTAAAFLIRQTSVGISVAAILWLVLDGVLSNKTKLILPTLLRIAAGFFAVVLPVAVYFAANGAFDDLWSAAIEFNFFYVAERGLADRINALLEGAGYLWQGGILLAGLFGFAFAIFTWRRGQKKVDSLSLFLQFLTLALLIEIVFVLLGGRPRAPYFIALLPVLALLAGYAIWLAHQWIAERSSKRWQLAAVAALAASFLLIQGRPYSSIVQSNRGIERPDDVYAFIEQRSAPDDYVLLIGAEAGVNFEARRRSPSRFAYQYALFREGYAEPEKLEEFYLDVMESKPELIIVTIDNGEIPNRFGPSKTPLSEQLTFQINQLYEQVMVFENGWVAYQYIGN